MNKFELDSRLAQDCIVIGKLNISQLLLMNNSLVPWFILVPERTASEITDLLHSEQLIILEEINFVSSFVKANFEISKLNTAAIGNIVSQLHIHIVGRNPSDYCWPNVVWGTKQRKLYTVEQIKKITTTLREQLNKFS